MYESVAGQTNPVAWHMSGETIVNVLPLQTFLEMYSNTS